MKRPGLVLWLIVVAIGGTGAVVRGLGYSLLAALLCMVLVAALELAPALLALEALQRQRRPDTFLRERGTGERRG